MSRNLNLKKGDKVVVAFRKRSLITRVTSMDMSIENIDNWTYEGIVKSVGERFIVVTFNNRDLQFVIDYDYQEKHYNSEFKLYLTKQEVIDELLLEEYFEKIKMKFNYSFINKYNIRQLTRILNILGTSDRKVVENRQQWLKTLKKGDIVVNLETRETEIKGLFETRYFEYTITNISDRYFELNERIWISLEEGLDESRDIFIEEYTDEIKLENEERSQYYGFTEDTYNSMYELMSNIIKEEKRKK